jgi:hypothetical protein
MFVFFLIFKHKWYPSLLILLILFIIIVIIYAFSFTDPCWVVPVKTCDRTYACHARNLVFVMSVDIETEKENSPKWVNPLLTISGYPDVVLHSYNDLLFKGQIYVIFVEKGDSSCLIISNMYYS